MKTLRTFVPWALAGVLAATLLPAQAQRAITSSSGGGGIGTLVLRNTLDSLDPCMATAGAESNGCRASTAPLSQSASIAYASDFGLAMGESWTRVTAPTNLFRWGMGDPTAALLRVSFDYSLRHNFVLGVGGSYTDANGSARDFAGYYIYRDVLVEAPLDPVNDPPLAPESFGNAMPSGTGSLLMNFFSLAGDVFVDDEGNLINLFDQARDLRISAVSLDFFHIGPTVGQGGPSVPLPGTLALVGLGLAGMAGLRRHRRR